MTTMFSTIDYVIFGAYALLIIFLGFWVSRTKKGTTKTTEDYFLAGKSLVWWAIGASCIAANISAEQLIGMTGSGFVMGIAMASYEFASAVILIFVGKFFLPVFIREGIYTMPQFLELRFSRGVRSGMAVFWILLYVFVNLTSILYMGALAIHVVLDVPLIFGIVILAAIALLYSLYGGLAAVAWTDILQVVLLVAGGVLTTYLALNMISGGEGVIQGAKMLYEKAPDKFHMVFSPQDPNYKEIPGMIGIVVGIVLVANSFYWGFNQYTIQRALGAKNIREAQHGVMFAGYLKLVMPILVVVPGMAAFVLLNDPELLSTLGPIDAAKVPTPEQADRAYPWLLGLLPNGMKGLAFAALCAAIISSLASMINSTSTIFTIDIYKLIRPDASDKRLLSVGRITAAAALLVACAIAPLLASMDQVFQYIQEFTGIVSPGIVAIFFLGMFWKRTTNQAAIWMAAATIPVSLLFMLLVPSLPFLNRMGIALGIVMGIGIIVSLLSSNKQSEKAIQIQRGMFRTTFAFNLAAFIILVVLAAFYVVFW